MSYEFTKLSEVPVVDAVSDSGHLFAEDGGNIVRVPASGGSAPVAIINVVEDENYNESISVATGTYSDIMEVFEGGEIPEIMLVKTYEAFPRVSRDHLQSIVRAGDEFQLHFYSMGLVWNPDDTIGILII